MTVINSILDNDLYKFTMQNAVVKIFPRAKVKYQFINRAETQFPSGFAEELRKEIYKMAELKLQPDEKDFLQRKCYYLDPTYLDFLRGYRFDPSEIGVIQTNGNLQVSIEGNWYRTILWEVPLMAMISELYFKMNHFERYSDSEISDIAREKIVNYNYKAVKIADFGTRRRFSFNIHDLVVKTLKEYGGNAFIGTSNVFFAKKYNLTPIGTHAHEWFMFHGAKYGYKMANKLALEHWVEVYRGDLGIALSDTYTSDVFFRAFDKKFAKLFDGVRQDSGEPLEFAQKVIEHYQSLNIDPKTKVVVFSDGLNPEEVSRIADFCRNKIGMSFGIGTNFTNDVGVKPLNIVVKIMEALPEGQNWVSTVKLSDTKGKHTGSPEAIRLCKALLEVD